MRTEPQQARSVARVEDLLDAAALVIREVGLERLTTQAVADRAGTSIGSLYRYFPNRLDLLRALGRRNLDRFAVRLISALDDQGGARDWWHLVDTAIDVFVEMHHDEVGFRALRLGDVIDEQLLSGTTTNNALMAEGMLALGEQLLGLEPTDELAFAARVATQITDTLLKLAFADDPNGDTKMIAECKRVVHQYLAVYLGSASTSPSGL